MTPSTVTEPSPAPGVLSVLTARDWRLFGLCAAATVAAGVLDVVPAGTVVPFVVAAVALALLASLVGHAVDALGDRLGAGATGVVQSALGNLPELFVCIFALKAGLYDVVRAALVGSVLANVLLVLGLAFVVGGLKHGTQRFGKGRARTISLMLVLAVFAWLIPSLTAALHTPAAGHEWGLSVVTAFLLLGLFGLSLPAAVGRGEAAEADGVPAGSAEASAEAAAQAPAPAGHTVRHDPASTAAADAEHVSQWPLALAIGVLAVAGVGAAFVSEWFVAALEPAMDAVGLSEAFAGLVVVAIAGNAVENVVGIQLAARNQADYALSVILQSPLQIALVLAPVLVLVAPLVGATFTLVLSPLLIVALLLAALVSVLVVNDGESTWFEGATLLVLYVLIAASFWWG
ncbi:calcium/proton exchanger [Kineosporia sp. A_224]|uniref:calcium/proton exchanger n=1 Tax=Kineosporia sp. A_224 TaxID=1962180 RepID=UPI0018E981A4|nr:calcium/proton exchanger [Kineosporia sp. A_224]